MVTTSEQEPATERRADRMGGRLREVVSGDRRGAVRRIILYGIAFGCIVSPWPVLAIVPMVLLYGSDQLA